LRYPVAFPGGRAPPPGPAPATPPRAPGRSILPRILIATPGGGGLPPVDGEREDAGGIMQGRAVQAYFVTLWTYGSRPAFADPKRAALFLHVLGGLRKRLGFRLYAYVLLPDRARLVLGAPGADAHAMRHTVQRLKSRFAREVNTRTGTLGLVWQDA